MSRTGRSIEPEGSLVIARLGGTWEQEVTPNGHMDLFRAVRMFWN